MSCMPNAGLPSVVDGKMHYDLTPDALAEHLARFVDRIRRQRRRRLLRHDARAPGRRGRGGAAAATPTPRRPIAEPAWQLDLLGDALQAGHLLPLIGERTNANGSKKFREAMLEGDWDTCVAIGQATRSTRAPTSWTSASTTPALTASRHEGADGAARHAVKRADHGRHHRDTRRAPRRCAGSGARPSLNSVNLEEGRRPRHPARLLPAPGRRVRRGGRRHHASTRRARPARRTGRSARRRRSCDTRGRTRYGI